MKKRILSMILMVTMIMGIFTGCGAGGSAETITVSEMFNSIIEENGKVVMYDYAKNGDKWSEDYVPTKNTEAMVYYYDGETLTAMRSEDMKLGNYLTDTSEINIKGTAIQNADTYLSLITDSNGEVLYESIKYKGSGTKNYYDVRFGEFTRMEIAGVSCMVFATYSYYTSREGQNGELAEVEYVIIEDTEFTKDKTIVFDSTKTEDVEVKKAKDDDFFYTYDRDWTIVD